MKRGILTTLLAAIAAVAVANADLWENVFYGLDLLATPLGSPLSTNADGTRVNGSRSGRLRIVPNGVLGGGYRLEFDRTFGPDSRGRTEVLHLGSIGDLALQGGVQATAGYTNTAGLWSASINFVAANLGYNMRTKLGAQDAEFRGVLTMANSLEINRAGFYDLTINVGNTDSEFLIDGVVVRDQDETNFDIGPIRVSGNIYYDATLALLNALGVDTSDLESVFPRSPIDRINDAVSEALAGLQAQINSAAKPELASLLLQTVLDGDQQAAAQLIDGLASDSLSNPAASGTSTLTVPEPATLLLMLAGGATIRYWRRRR